MQVTSPLEQSVHQLKLLLQNKQLPKESFFAIKNVIQNLCNASLSSGHTAAIAEWKRRRITATQSQRHKRLGNPSLEDAKEMEREVEMERWLTQLFTQDIQSSKPDFIDEVKQFDINLGSQNSIQSLASQEDSSLQVVMSQIDSYNFDVFELANLTGNQPLFFIGMALFKRYSLGLKFDIDKTKLSNFLHAIEDGYSTSAPYHNCLHAADVARTVHFFIIHTLIPCGNVSDNEIFALIVSALIHDFDHPGRNNAYHIASRDEKSTLYNDKSVLENHHLAQSFLIIYREENNIFASFFSKDDENEANQFSKLKGKTAKEKKNEFFAIRKQIIELVLATDLGMLIHLDIYVFSDALRVSIKL